MSLPAIDIHTHMVPGHFPASLAGAPSAIEIRRGCDCGHAEVFVDGRQFRSITDECWDIGRRLETMDRMGIGRQILSPMPELLSFWRPADEAAAIAEHVNAELAAMVERAPGRFAALGMVPLQDPDRAIRMLEKLMAERSFLGVEIGTNIGGIPLGDARFRPFFAAAERVGAAIFVHPLKPLACYPLPGPGAMEALACFPCETALAAVSIIASNIAIDHPGLRIAFSHGGGALSLLLPRLDHGWRTTPAVGAAIADLPSLQARRFFYDMLVYDGETLRFLMRSLGKTQLCIGTDLPFAVAERDPLGRIAGLELLPADEGLLRHGNAARFLGFEEDGPQQH
ncbi:amidohydrolase family protein [Rhizorhabdus dicambivorans]|nr:amidohydrolase family protein [Rhizorhabdus dicambivorans]